MRWVYISDRKTHSLITPPYHLTSLVTEEEVELKFTAPNKEGIYNFTVCVRSDSYLGVDLLEDIKLDVQKAWEAPKEHKQWDFSVVKKNIYHILIRNMTDGFCIMSNELRNQELFPFFRMTKRMTKTKKMIARKVNMPRIQSLRKILIRSSSHQPLSLNLTQQIRQIIL